MNPPLPEVKAALRRELLRQRAGCSPETRKMLDEELNRQLCALPLFRAADTVLGYYPIGSAARGFEPDIRPALLQALAQGKRVALPRCVPQDGETRKREMEFFLIESFDGLRPGSFGVPEPEPALHQRLTQPERGLCLVPGLAFDGDGYRLGYGKGYYDRFLARLAGQSLGICYEQFLLKQLPCGYYDRSVDAVLTQHAILYVKERSNNNG